MSVGKIDDLVSQAALDQLDQLFTKLGITTDKMASATEQATKLNAALGDSKGLQEFQAAQEKSAAAMQGVISANNTILSQQKEIATQTQAVVDATKAKALADVDVNKILVQLNGTTEANIKVLVDQKTQLTQVSNELKEHSKQTALSAQSVAAHSAKTVELTKRQLELKESTAKLTLLVKQQIKEQAAAATSNEALTAQLNQARKAYNQLSAEEAQASVKGRELLETIELLTLATTQANEKQGKFNDNVGNYKSALNGASEPQSKFGLAIDKVTNLQNIGAMAVQRFASQLIRLGTSFLIIGVGFAAIQWLYEWIKNLDIFTGRLNQAYQNLQALNSVMKDADQIAGKHIATLKVLYDTATDVSKSDKDRKAAADELIKLFPAQLKNSTDTQIMNGKEAASIDLITAALIKQAKGEAALSKIKEIEAQKLDIEFTKDKIRNANANERSAILSGKSGTIQGGGRGATKGGLLNMSDQRAAEALKLNNENEGILNGQEKFLESYIGAENISNAAIADDKKKPKKDNSAKKENDEDLKNVKARLEQEKVLAKLILDDDNSSYDARLKALRIYIDRSNKLIDTELKIANQAPGISAKAKDTNNVNADTQRAQLRVEDNKEQEKIQKDLNASILNSQKELLAQQTAADKAYIETFINSQNEQMDAIENDKANSLAVLADKYSKGKLLTKDYNNQVYAIEAEAAGRRIDLQIDTLTKIIQSEAAQVALGGDAKALQTNVNALGKLKIQRTEQGTKNVLHNAGENDPNKDKQKLIELEARTGEEILGLAKTFNDQIIAQQEERYRHQAELIEQNASIEKSAIERGVGSQQQKANKIAQIDANTTAQKKAFQDKENQLLRKKAIADKIAAEAAIVINTAVAVTKAEADLGPILGTLAIPFVIALGAIQAAAVAAAPLPAYATGTDSAKGGFAHVGEQGTELRIDPSGRLSLTPGVDTITHLDKGTKIIPHHKLIQMMAKPDEIHYAGGQAIDINKVVDAQKETTQAIRGLQMTNRRNGINVNNRFNDYKTRNGLN